MHRRFTRRSGAFWSLLGAMWWRSQWAYSPIASGFGRRWSYPIGFASQFLGIITLSVDLRTLEAKLNAENSRNAVVPVAKTK